MLTLLLAAAFGAQGQQLDPKEYIYPVREVSGLCSANFGEMRPGHFHAGVDIKTEGVEGKTLVAVADGYVSRVVISAGGYGRAVYLTLRNGKTAVYGHLQRFRDDIEHHVNEERYRRGSNGADLWFDAARWPVRQGDVIGYSGNSGSSMGPHLHFELRDERTQKRYNLVREGIIRPEDTLPPRIMRLHYVEIDTLRGVPVRAPLESYAVVREAEGRYRLTRREAVPTGRNGYFIVEVTDRRNGVHNTFGVWRVTAFRDTVPYFEYRMDGFTYEQARCCDAVSCYALQLTSRNEAVRLARMAGAPAEFYPILEDRGVIRTAEGEEHRIRIEAEDDSGNRSQLEFTIRGRSGSFHAAAGIVAATQTGAAAGTTAAGTTAAGTTATGTTAAGAAAAGTTAAGTATAGTAGNSATTAETTAPVATTTTATAATGAIRALSEAPSAPADTAAVVLRHDRAGSLHLGRELTVYVPEGALYEPLFCRPERLDRPRLDTGLTALSPLYRIFDARTPLHRAVTVSIRTAVPPSLQLHAVAAIRTAKGHLICAGGTYADGAVTVATRSTGEMMIVADTLPPAVRPLFNPGADLSRAASLRFRASDNFSGIAAWTLRIDGRQIPCDRFPMRGTLVHTFGEKPDGQRHRAVLTVTDGCGNTTRWEGTFYR